MFTYLCIIQEILVICQLQNAKSNFLKFCKVNERQNQKTNLIYLYIHLVENLCFDSSFKNRFQEALLVKVINTKKYTTCT